MTTCEGFVETDCAIHWRRDGIGPRTIVMLHEMGGSIHSFDRVIERLGDTDCSFVRIDQRGFGRSGRPERPYPFGVLADDVRAVLDRLGIAGPVDILGVAGGTAIAADLAISHPHRVARLMLCAPSLTFTPEARSATLARADAMMSARMSDLAAGALLAMYPEAIRDEAFTAYRERFLANDPVGYAMATRALGKSNFDPAAIVQPTLFLAGDHDLRPVAAVAALAVSLPAATIEEVRGGGHIMAVQAPAAVADHARRFLEIPMSDREA